MIALALGGLLFGGLLLWIALGGGGDDDSSGRVLLASAAVAEGGVAGAAAIEEPAVEARAVEERFAAPAAEEPVAAEPAGAEAADEDPAALEASTEELAVEDSAVGDPSGEDLVTVVVRPAVIGADSPPIPPGAPERHSILRDGKIYVRGTLPTVEIENQLIAAIELVMGGGNVVSESAIDPSKPFDRDVSSPVYIDDTILFAPASAEISPDSYALIAPASILLAVQPTVVVTITGHTDDVGSPASNLKLSQDRVDAVRDWVISQGGDGDRLIAIGKGESEPVADNATPEGRQQNRRVEFLIEGFKFG